MKNKIKTYKAVSNIGYVGTCTIIGTILTRTPNPYVILAGILMLLVGNHVGHKADIMEASREVAKQTKLKVLQDMTKFVLAELAKLEEDEDVGTVDSEL